MNRLQDMHYLRIKTIVQILERTKLWPQLAAPTGEKTMFVYSMRSERAQLVDNRLTPGGPTFVRIN